MLILARPVAAARTDPARPTRTMRRRPPMAKVRRARRILPPRRARLAMRMLTTRGVHQVTLAALTLYGATLRGTSRLRRRELVALRLASGHRVKARVRWHLGNRCGITFLVPVADFARLLYACRVARALASNRLLRRRYRTS